MSNARPAAQARAPGRAVAADGPFATEEIAAGIHIRRGVDEDATSSNEDAIANIGFIIGRDGVLVTDPGARETVVPGLVGPGG